MATNPFPWEQVMRFGLGILKLSPSEFWNMSLRELDAAMKAHGYNHSDTISRTWLNEAMSHHPDRGRN